MSEADKGAKHSVEMESITSHTYNGQSYEPGDRFHVEGDGGGWSAEMFADSLTAIKHAVRATPKKKAAEKVEDEPAKPAEKAAEPDVKKKELVAAADAKPAATDKAHYGRKDLKAK